MHEIKTIHYCWFGRGSLPESAIKCIESWKKYCPLYEIKEWNEDNFDINICEYTTEAYRQRKFAFVSDMARYYILYNFGGIYLDTDVELIKNLDELLDAPFMGFETYGAVAPGLIMYAYPEMNFYKTILDKYMCLSYVESVKIGETVVDITTTELNRCGLILNNTMQIIDGMKIYPMEYFNPKGNNFSKINITDKTYSIHHYDASWKDKNELKLMRYRQKFGRRWGTYIFAVCHPILALKKKKK